MIHNEAMIIKTYFIIHYEQIPYIYTHLCFSTSNRVFHALVWIIGSHDPLCFKTENKTYIVL